MSQEQHKLQLSGDFPVILSAQSDLNAVNLFDVQESNTLLLNTIIGLDEKAEVDNNHELVHELNRLDTKLNLVMEMIGQLLVQTDKLPGPQAVSLDTTQLVLADNGTIEVGSLLLIEIFLKSYIPRPIKLFGEVSSKEAGNLVITLSDIGEHVADLITKLIFKQHRKEIANTRKVHS